MPRKTNPPGLPHRTKRSSAHRPASNHSPSLSRHAATRAGQRSVSSDAIDATLSYGRRIEAQGCVHYILGRRQIDGIVRSLSLTGPARARLYDWNGTVVLCGDDDYVITVFTNPKYRPREGGHK